MTQRHSPLSLKLENQEDLRLSVVLGGLRNFTRKKEHIYLINLLFQLGWRCRIGGPNIEKHLEELIINISQLCLN